MLVDAICGAGFPSMEYAQQATSAGFARYTGNQWNPDWEWDRKQLETFNKHELQVIYDDIVAKKKL